MSFCLFVYVFVFAPTHGFCVSQTNIYSKASTRWEVLSLKLKTCSATGWVVLYTDCTRQKTGNNAEEDELYLFVCVLTKHVVPPNSTVRVCRSFSFSSYRHIRAYACLRCSLLGNKKLKKNHIDSSWYYFWEKSIHWIKAYIAQGWIIMNLETDCWTVTLTLEMEAWLYANWKSEWELKMTKQLKHIR